MPGPAISARAADRIGMVIDPTCDQRTWLIANRNQFHGRSKNYSQYLQLAISIAVDLRLDRKPIHQKPDPGSKRDPIATKTGTETWGSEEQRAAAGIFYISSTCVANAKNDLSHANLLQHRETA
jgi:hypothetical protein